MRFIQYVGPLRALLYLLTFILVFFSAAAGGEVVYSGWGVVPTLVVPALVPIVFFVLLLDVMMSAVFMVDRQGALRRRYRNLLGLDLGVWLLLTAAWLPFFLSLGEP